MSKASKESARYIELDMDLKSVRLRAMANGRTDGRLPCFPHLLVQKGAFSSVIKGQPKLVGVFDRG